MEGEKIRILLIEDNPGDARLIKELLAAKERTSFDLEHADRISTGLAQLAKGGVDVILLDLSLPDSQGLEGLNKILAQTQEVPIVVLSGLSDEAVAIESMHAGVQDYLVKGCIDRDLLVRSLRYAIERQRLRVAYRESEARYRLLADNIADVIWTADSEARITYVSPSIKQFLGYTVEEAMKLKISDILTHDSADQARRFVKSQIGTYARGSQPPPSSMTLEHVRKDGSTVWAEVMLSFLQGKDGRIMGIMGATRNITERRKAEEALRQNEDYFKALSENSSDGIVVLNRDGTVRYESPSFERLLGYKPEDRLGKSSFEFVHPDDIPLAARLFEQLMQNPGSTITAEVRAKHKDGSLHILEVMGKNLVNNAAVGGIVANFRDITERRKAEEALRESEIQHRSLVETASKAGLGITIVQNTQDKEAVFAFVNDEYCKMSGYSREELLGRSAWDTIPHQYIASIRERYRRRQDGKNVPGYYEASILRKDGTSLPVETGVSTLTINGKVATVSFFRDITERRKAEEALRESEGNLRVITNNVQDLIAQVDIEGRYRYLSPAYKTMLGYEAEDALGKNVLEFTQNVHPGDLDIFISSINQTFSTLLPGRIQYRFRHAEGYYLWLESQWNMLIDNQGAVNGAVIVSRDITERKKMEEALRQSEANQRMITDNAQDLIAQLDAELVYRYVSPSYKTMLGYEADEIVGQNAIQADQANIHPDDIEATISAMNESLSTLLPGRIQYRLKHKDGHYVWLESQWSYLLGQNREMQGVVIVSRDITEHKRMEEELTRLSDAVKISTDSITITDLEGRVLDINEATLKLQGAENKEDLIGLKPFETIVPEEQERALADLAKVIEKGSVSNVQYHALTRDGRKIFVETSISLMKGANGEPIGIVAVTRDITERKRMEEALRESEERYRLNFENASDVIWSIDPDGKIISMSPAVESLLGYKPEELIGTNISDTKFQTPETVEKALSNLNRILAGERVLSTECEFIAKNGTVKLGEVNGAPIFTSDGKLTAVVCVGRDITERKRIEEALRESEEKYRLYFENASDVIYLVSPEGRLLNISPSVETVLGYKPEGLIGEGFLDLNIYSPESLEAAIADMMRVLEGERIMSREREFIAKDGAKRFAEVNAAPVTSLDGKVVAIMCAARDITERKRMEEALRQSEEKYRLHFENISDVVFSYDHEFRILDMSPSIKRMLGYSPEELIGRRFTDIEILAPEFREIAVTNSIRLLAGEHVGTMEYIFIAKDGSRKYGELTAAPLLSDDGKVLGIVSVGRDITERKKMEEALKENEERFRVVFEGTSIGIALVKFDRIDRKVIGINPAFERMLGYSLEEFRELTNLQYLHPDDAILDAELYVEMLKGKRDHYTVDKRYIRKDGKVIWGQQNISVIRGAAGKPEYSIVIIEDITERKRMEEEKQRLMEQIQLAGRLAAVGELAAGVAHELNNPIAAIKGFAQLLAAKEDVDVSMKKDLQTIYRESQRAAKITQNLLSFARKHEPEKHLISLNDALEKTLDLRVHTMKLNNIELVAELAPDLPQTLADFHQMQQVFINIINNAEQAMVEVHGKGRLLIRTKKVRDVIQISFADNGPGISEENMQRIFDPFFTTKEVGKGTGLGLSICYGLVEAHGGRIYARSILGQGATFVVEIPIVLEDRPVAEAALLKSSSRSTRWKKPRERY